MVILPKIRPPVGSVENTRRAGLLVLSVMDLVVCVFGVETS
jgi:hypothetical protein